VFLAVLKRLLHSAEVRIELVIFDQGILKGKYQCTIDLLFDWFGLVWFENKNKNCQLSNS
jgi:hypothetical protein